MEGFFTKKEAESQSRPDGKSLSCVSCGLHRLCKNPKMKPFGNFKKEILLIGEAPSEADDSKGLPWQGKIGRYFQQTYKRLGIDIFEDCVSINAVNCRPISENEGTNTPTNYEIDCCRKSILATIQEYKPKVIILLGNSAIYSVIGHRWKKDLGTVNKWRGWAIPDQDFNAWICPTFHPSYVEKVNSIEVNTIWEQDLKKAVEISKIPFKKYKEPVIKELTDLSILTNLEEGLIAFDYETTGLKPHAEGHRVVCVSIATGNDFCYVFMMPQSRRERQPFINLLASAKGKIAHNMKFEHHWSTVKLRQEVNAWEWDTMLAAHILDNRPGVTSLKFQTYVHFGIVDYASEVEPYLHSVDSTNGNAFNRVLEFIEKPGGKDKLLHYCGLDAIHEFRLYNLQSDLIFLDRLPF